MTAPVIYHTTRNTIFFFFGLATLFPRILEWKQSKAQPVNGNGSAAPLSLDNPFDSIYN
jgi:hypothetical protein